MSIIAELLLILAVAAAAFLAASGAGFLALASDARSQGASDVALPLVDHRARSLASALGHGLFDAGAFTFLSPMVAFLGLVFLATLAPVLFTMIPFFIVWSVRTHDERVQEKYRRWAEVAGA